MRRKFAVLVTALALLAAGHVADAQQAGKMPRVGWLLASSPPSRFPEQVVLQGLRELGWVEGKNVTHEFRWAEGSRERLIQQAAELVRLKVDVIVTFTAGVGVARQTVKTIPVVFGTSQDPVRAGFVASLARPGGNLTGVTFLMDELAGKRLELLKEAVPTVSRAAVLWEPAHVDSEFKGMEAAAPGLGVRLQSLEVPRPPRPDEAERAIEAARDGRAQALILAPSGFTISQRKRIIDLAAKSGLPVISAWRTFADAGALLTYGPDTPEMSRRVATYVDRILKGAKPADLPVEQPTKFELVINLKTAKALGITIPPELLSRADRVIK